jgi:hypothetical protein
LQEAPELNKSFNPWDRISQPESLAEILKVSGIKIDVIEEQKGHHPINSPEDWWTILLGSGTWGPLNSLMPVNDKTSRKPT